MPALPSIPNFVLGEELGKGGMSRVYLANQLQPKRAVAIKVVSPGKSSTPGVLESLQQEGNLIASLSHDNIITIYVCGVVDAHFFMAMELLRGGDLAQRIKQGLSEAEALAVMLQIGSALEHAHEQDILHRDIKPENVMFHKNGKSVLVDFGIAKAKNTQSAFTLAGNIVGTPHYMSPEHCTGALVDQRSDLYAMGVLFYEMLTGQKVFSDSATSVSIAMAHIYNPPPELPAKFVRYSPIVQRLLKKNPAERYQNASEMLEDLRQLSAMPKGSNVNLSQQVPGLSQVMVWLGWDARGTDGSEFDLDASAFLTTIEGKVRADTDFIFYNNKVSSDGSVRHAGDNLTGGPGVINAGVGEQLQVDLTKVPPDIAKIAFAVTIHEGKARRQTFGQVSNATIRISNLADNKELARYNLSGDVSNETAMIVGELYRASSEWRFRAVGQGFRGGLGELARYYGVDVD